MLLMATTCACSSSDSIISVWVQGEAAHIPVNWSLAAHLVLTVLALTAFGDSFVMDTPSPASLKVITLSTSACVAACRTEAQLLINNVLCLQDVTGLKLREHGL